MRLARAKIVVAAEATPHPLPRSTARCDPLFPTHSVVSFPGIGGVGGTVGGLVALCFVLAAYLSLYLVQEGLGDDLGSETYANASGFTATRSTPKPFFVMWTLHCGYTVFLFIVMPVYQAYLLCAGMPLLQIPVRNLLLAALFNGTLLASDYLWSLSLVYTNPAPNAAIFQSLGAVVYAMSLIPTSIPLPIKSIVRALSPALDTWFCSPLWRVCGVAGMSTTCCASHSWRKVSVSSSRCLLPRAVQPAFAHTTPARALPRFTTSPWLRRTPLSCSASVASARSCTARSSTRATKRRRHTGGGTPSRYSQCLPLLSTRFSTRSTRRARQTRRRQRRGRQRRRATAAFSHRATHQTASPPRSSPMSSPATHLSKARTRRTMLTTRQSVNLRARTLVQSHCSRAQRPARLQRRNRRAPECSTLTCCSSATSAAPRASRGVRHAS